MARYKTLRLIGEKVWFEKIEISSGTIFNSKHSSPPLRRDTSPHKRMNNPPITGLLVPLYRIASETAALIAAISR